MAKEKKDTRFVYGVGCCWFGSIYETKQTTPQMMVINGTRMIAGGGIPCCPHCGGLLMEVPTEEGWWKGAEDHEAAGNPGYVAMLRWAVGKHFTSMTEMKEAYERELPGRS